MNKEKIKKICPICDQELDEKRGYHSHYCCICYRAVCGCCINLIGNYRCCLDCCKKGNKYTKKIKNYTKKTNSILKKWRHTIKTNSILNLKKWKKIKKKYDIDISMWSPKTQAMIRKTLDMGNNLTQKIKDRKEYPDAYEKLSNQKNLIFQLYDEGYLNKEQIGELFENLLPSLHKSDRMNIMDNCVSRKLFTIVNDDWR